MPTRADQVSETAAGLPALLKTLSRQPTPTSCSVHGESGTGRSVLAAYIAFSLQALGTESALMVIGPPASARQLLNQMAAVSLPPFEPIFRRRLRILQSDALAVDTICEWIERHRSTRRSALVVDNFHLAAGADNESEARIHKVASLKGISSVVVTSNPPLCPQVDVRIELTRHAVDVETGQWDAVFRLRVRTLDERYRFRIGNDGLSAERIAGK